MKLFYHLLSFAFVFSLCSACHTRTIPEFINPSRQDVTEYNYEISVDATQTGEVLPNVVSNINLWHMGTAFINPSVKGRYNIFDFVEYVQLMTATGGTVDRDLFKNPSDKSVLDDYDFDRLIKNCHGILSLGAKPHIKFGNVPFKLSKSYSEEFFGINVYPPADYGQYYKYIRAIVQALCDEFGKDELLSWHYGVFTEYENKHWFIGIDGTEESAAEEFCKIYDWTVQALIDVIGQDGLYVGAHSMTVTEGLWDERIFIRHCAEGKNWANGGTGSHISYLSASFYDRKPGKFTSGLDLPHTIAHLKNAADSCGLTNLKYGVDEGRILYGAKGSQKKDISSRTCGYTYMAAYDARLYTQMIDAGGSYLSSWQYLSKSLFDGNPSVSYHVASNISKLAGMARASTGTSSVSAIKDAEIGVLAGTDPASGKTNVMIYNFANDIDYSDTASIKLTIKTGLKPGRHKITLKKVNDDCNYFDDWMQDRKDLGITDDMFKWSPDDGCIVGYNIIDSTAAAKYSILEAGKYAEKSELFPVSGTIRIDKDGTAALRCELGGNNVWFLEIN